MFQIAIDTDTMPVSPAVYADEYRGRALPTVLPLVQGFRGNLRVYFLGEHTPSENAAVALYLRALQSKEKLVQTGLGTRGISDAGNVYYDVPLAADTTALSAVLGNRENVIMRAGIVANDVTASPQTNFEWQLNIAVSASAIGTGEKPPVSPNAIEEHNNDVSAHPFILQKIAAAEVDVSGLRTSIAGVSESLNATNTNLNNAKSELSTEISEVSAALDAETIARENEDAAIRAALESETNERKDAVSSISENVSAVYSELKATDDAICAALDKEKDVRASSDNAIRLAVASEAGLRKSADSEIRAALTEEETARSESVSELRSEVFTEISTVSASLAAEKTARESEDAAIRAALESETTDRSSQGGAISEALMSERSERIEMDSQIEEHICREGGRIGNHCTEIELISGEISGICSRISGIEGALNCEVSNRIGNDTNLRNLLSSEMSCRISADSELGEKINSLRSMTNTLINSENTCRTAADNALRGSINTLNSDVAAIEGNIQTLENKATALSEHTVCSELHWMVDEENKLILKSVGGGNGFALYDSKVNRGIYIIPTCDVCFSPIGNKIVFEKDGSIFLISDMQVSISSYSGEISVSCDVSILSRDGGVEISASCGKSKINLVNDGRVMISSTNLSLHSTDICMFSFNSLEISGRFMSIKAESTINVRPGLAKYNFNSSCLSLCRSGGAILKGNSSQTALYFGTTPFATSKIDSGSRVVCFGNPLGKVNIKAGNGGRIDICATCVYVNGVKIST